MPGDLYKEFGRNFIIAFFLPAIIFMTISAYLFGLFFPHLVPSIRAAIDDWGMLFFSGASLFCAWAFGVVLMALSRVAIRVLEGYHLLKYLGLHKIQLRKLAELDKQIEMTSDRYNSEMERDGDVSVKTRTAYREQRLKRQESFPPKADQALATGFGNLIRAAELYPSEVYGIDAIAAWPRMMGVIPAEYIEYLDRSKAPLYFAVNSFYLSLSILVEYGIFSFIARTLPQWWLPVIFIGLVIFLYHMALSAARQWGSNIKAVYDLYRFDLLKKMGILIPETWEGERECWKRVNWMFLYWEKPEPLKRDVMKSKPAKTGQEKSRMSKTSQG